MFCPKCAAENAESAQFCRGCGANISLVPQAVSGQLAERFEEEGAVSCGDKRQKKRHGEAVTVERAVRSLFMGVAFILVAFSVRVWVPAGHLWWFWMFLPAAGMLADGVSTFLRLRERRARLATPAYAPGAPLFAPPRHVGGLAARSTGELAQPPSVTEAATQHLATPPKRAREDA
jgi:zinc-ribbon domain